MAMLNKNYFKLDFLVFAATLAALSDLGFLWFREFYLESSRVIQVERFNWCNQTSVCIARYCTILILWRLLRIGVLYCQLNDSTPQFNLT